VRREEHRRGRSAAWRANNVRPLSFLAALGKELIALGVASTLSGTARRILERSAEQAGFYEAGRGEASFVHPFAKCSANKSQYENPISSPAN
jgi:hypothetical protein